MNAADDRFMGVLQQKLRRIFRTEEIPRAIGIMLVLVFVIAVGGVSLVTFLHQQSEARAQLTDTLESAVELLADRLEAATEESTNTRQLQMLQFAAHYPCRVLRIYTQQDGVVASLNPNEVGQSRPALAADIPQHPQETGAQWLEDEDGRPVQLLVRTPVRVSEAPAPWYLETVLTPDATTLGSEFPVGAMAVAAMATIALLVVYRRLRRDMASVSRIAEHLLHNQDSLAESVHDMRMTQGGDRIAACWNRFVDHVCKLDEEVARSNASSELLAALSRNDAGELAGAMTTAPIGVVLANEQGNVLYANAMARRLVGWTLDESVARSFDDADLSPDGRRIVETIKCGSGGEALSRSLEAQVEGADGSFYQVQVIPVRGSQKSPRVLAMVQDVSQQVRADKAREEFVSQVTHELRTPLTNIRAYTETLSSGEFSDPQVIAECYNVITKETRRLARLVEDILSISQLEVGSMKLVVDNVDLRGLLTEAVRDVRGIAESKRIDVQLSLPAKLGPCKADRDKLAVVVNNLLGNALKYTPEGGSVTVSCKTTDTQVQIAVRDTGIGIDPKDHHRIFEKFQRADDEAVRAETGTGIGLTTAREIAQQHGGDIHVVSRKGEGATFTVTLPASGKPAAAPEAVTV